MALPWLAWGAESILGSGLSGLFGAAGGAAGLGVLKNARSELQGLPGRQGPIDLTTAFGNTSQGMSQFSPGFQANQAALGTVAPSLLGGGLFNSPGLQAALGSNDISGALAQANQALGTQMGPGTGALGGLAGQSGALGGLFTNAALAGPQDFTGGLQGNLLNQGFANQLAAGNQAGLQSQQLSALRSQAQPTFDRQFNQLQDRLFAQGRLGSTGGAEQLRGLFEAQNQADLGFQTEAFNRALQQQQFLGGLGSQQLGQGAGFLGQNLGQYNQNVANAQGFLGLSGQFEGQQFGQGLQSLQANQNAGLQRLAAAQGLMGFGGDLFAQQFGLGLGAQEGLLGFGDLGLRLARSPYELQASLLQGSGEHAGATSNLAQAQAKATGGLFGGIGKALGGLFSDRRLKDNLYKVGTRDGISWYTWEWNDKAFEVGASNQPSFGVIADEVEQVMPEAVFEVNGYKTVNYDMILGDK